MRQLNKLRKVQAMIEDRVDNITIFNEHFWRTIDLYQATLNKGESLSDSVHTVREVQAALYAISEEVQEAVSELPDERKPWKGVDRFMEEHEFYHSFKEETIDVLFMLVRLWLMAGMTPEEIDKLFRDKLRKNLTRPDHNRTRTL